MTEINHNAENNFKVQTEQFADIRILRYRIPGFEELPLKKKELLFYLYEAALSGRDILWDQNYKYNLLIRKTLENIVKTYPGDRNSEDWNHFLVYTKRVWFSNGIHHHNSMDKIKPEFSETYFKNLIKEFDLQDFPDEFIDEEGLSQFLIPILFDERTASKRVVQDEGADLVLASANNFYGSSQ